MHQFLCPEAFDKKRQKVIKASAEVLGVPLSVLWVLSPHVKDGSFHVVRTECF